MRTFDLCLAWTWEFDADFVALLDSACRARWRSLLQITPANLDVTLARLTSGEIRFHTLYDRACDFAPEFLPIITWSGDHCARAVNPYPCASRSWDKATMHLDFITAGLHTPYTIILSSFNDQPDPPGIDLNPLGYPFIIKPAHGGGGDGVIMEAWSADQVCAARREHPADKYLLQTNITPVCLEGRPAWFRVIYCMGRVYANWWDTSTHIYSPLASQSCSGPDLTPLTTITTAIAHLTGLSLFSTEIALVEDGRFIVVDYVNEQLDLRLQSSAPDGVPNWIVNDIATRLAQSTVSQQKTGR
jgi:hypothetical protein